MGNRSLSASSYSAVRSMATAGGTRAATHDAETSLKQGLGLDPLVDPKGLPHLGPVRMSLPRLNEVNGLWQLTRGLPMPVETLLDTTASMGDNVQLAFDALPHDYAMLAEGELPVLGRYDVQVATAIFNDVDDSRSHWGETAVLARTQYEMAEKIAKQMAMLPPGRNGSANNKEDSQYGLFAAAYLTDPRIREWGLKPYHFVVSDEPIGTSFQPEWLHKLFGDDVFDKIKENGFDIGSDFHPDLATVVKTLGERAHRFFLEVPGWRGAAPGTTSDYVYQQWSELYDPSHVVILPGSTEHLHFVKTVIIGLTEGVLDLQSVVPYLTDRGLTEHKAEAILDAVAHIDVGAQAKRKGFESIPLAGAYFRNKNDLIPLTDDEVAEAMSQVGTPDGDEPQWM
jgi:hypothetical protein